MRDVGKSRAGSTWILCFTFESSASSRSCIDAHPKSGTCREIHTQAQTSSYSHCPRTPEHRNRAIYNWTLAVADINFFFLFFFRTSQTASLSSSLVLRFGLRRAVCVAQTRSSPHGPPHRAGGLRLAFGCCSGEFRKGTDGCTGDRLQFKT